MDEIILVDNINASNAVILPISNGIVLSIPAGLVNNQHLDTHHEHAMDASMMTESTDIMILKENTRKTSRKSVEVHVLFTNVFLPCCLSDGITFPFHVVLISSSSSLMFEDCFNFIDLFAL
jgi:hypothetical protein